MELRAKNVLETLKKKGVDTLYHANTVRTSCAFLHRAHLLSRGVMDESGLELTAQKSDASDRALGLWYDVFLDGIDIHARSSRLNVYGPVLFEFDIEVLSQSWLPSLWVTRSNPMYWKTTDPTSLETVEKRWFTSEEALAGEYQRGNFDKMLVLRNIGGSIRLAPYLKRVVVDQPQRPLQGLDTYSCAVGALRASARAGGLGDKLIEARTCPPQCQCTQIYSAAQMDEAAFTALFAP